jgi:type I restriction enzyme R subunit
MRPYQIAATEKILSKIQIAQNYKQMGSLKAGGYVWHTTGSGKTLTSFKTAQLATTMPFIDKVLFVVDRKDLDYQTMREYDRFQKGAANSNTSTRILRRQLEDDNSKIIITTIQKLSVFIKSNKGHEVFQKHIVIIFDECHRSQFGDMHKAITKFFKKYHLFGFTGTPIFAVNAGSGGNPSLKTTPQAFGDQLHTYTIVDAINDGNVLPFHIDYINTMRMKDSLPDVEVSGINTEEALRDPARIREIVKYILEHFDQKTKRSSFYSLQGQRVAGFNSIFAVSSIPMAKLYYSEFKRQMQEGARKFTVATIFSFSPNEAQPDDVLPEEEFDTSGLDQTSRDFLDSAISDYNATFSVNFDTSSDKFENYYKDISMRVKNREIDLLIVVNMFLTGFDATTLNTLWVDKNLRHHGLLQAFSRTNRILNSVKTYGNIVCFRNLQKETDASIALFGDKEAGSIVLLKRYEDYYYGYESEGTHTSGYVDLIDELLHKFPIGQPIQGEQSQKEFISLYGAILRLKNILTAFDTFEGNEILPDRDFQDYQSSYIDLYQALSGSKRAEKEKINDDIVFEIELIRQVEINIDYILMLVERYHQENCKDKDILVSIDKAVNSSIQLRSKKDLIQAFIAKVNMATNVKEDWQKFVEEQKDSELEDIIQEEKLKPEPTKRYIANSFRDGSLRTTGTDIDRIMPALSRFGAGNRGEKKQTVIQKLTRFFEKFFGIVA